MLPRPPQLSPLGLRKQDGGALPPINSAHWTTMDIAHPRKGVSIFQLINTALTVDPAAAQSNISVLIRIHG
ncbi:hypothetical protein P691DRAFT_804016 [Macrolepiota fuliginosa MF-IS2]|uniref:Uncharacterized protein n=1 Tax=Macrolepiota fuliginosa MF-IS2 TaxID=1400762 RepID=A0A9P5X9U8_9AGAR|nr:hypothetical protein P691DRAFT_804016 [Macrolepiota fuliginosa MF-IS2]